MSSSCSYSFRERDVFALDDSVREYEYEYKSENDELLSHGFIQVQQRIRHERPRGAIRLSRV